MISALLVDDEQTARLTLRRMLALYCPEVTIAGEAEDIIAGAKAINALQPDIVFLDIRIGQHNGFDLLDLLPDINFQLVFVTAYDEYAVQAFHYNALDYLLKPIDPDRLQEVVARCQKEQPKDQLHDRLDRSRKQINGHIPNTLVISNDQGYHFLLLEELMRLSSNAGVTSFYTKSKDIISVARNIGTYEYLLSNQAFFRCHQSHIINFRWVSSYLFQDGGTIMMRDGTSVPLARSRKEAFLEHLKHFQ
jgi:two-component system LytT family response regulator